MKSGGTFILGGLLQGLGKGVTNMHEERRQNALLKLKREQELQDQATTTAATEAARVQAQRDRLEVIDRTGSIDSEQAAAARLAAAQEKKEEREYKKGESQTEFERKKELTRYEEYLTRTRPKDEKQKTLNSAVNNEDGSTTLLFNDGTTEVRTDLPKARESARASGDGTILGDRGKPAATAPKPAAPTASGLGALPPPPDGKPGRTMTGPGGKKAYWNGRTWVLMTPGNAAEQRRLLNGG